jgi:toxin ParE1/3/4
MSAKLIIRPQVYWDLDDIAAFINKDNQEAARRFLESAEATFEMLAEASGIGSLYFVRRSQFQELRCFPVRGFKNYLIFYDRSSTAVEIVRVLHGARNIPVILRRNP